MPALRMTLCLLRWNSLAATQSPPKNSSVTLRMGKTLEALTAPAEGRRNSSGYAPVSSETPLLRSWGVCKPDRAERERSPHILSGLGDWCQPLSGLCSGGPALGGGHFKSLSNVTSCLHCKFLSRCLEPRVTQGPPAVECCSLLPQPSSQVTLHL